MSAKKTAVENWNSLIQDYGEGGLTDKFLQDTETYGARVIHDRVAHDSPYNSESGSEADDGDFDGKEDQEDQEEKGSNRGRGRRSSSAARAEQWRWGKRPQQYQRRCQF